MKKTKHLFGFLLFFCINLGAQTITNLTWQTYPLQVTEVSVSPTQKYLRIACYDSLTNQLKYDSTQAYDNIIYSNVDGVLACGSGNGGNSAQIIIYDFEKSAFSDTLIVHSNCTLNTVFTEGHWTSILFSNVSTPVFYQHFISFDIAAGFFKHFSNSSAEFLYGGIEDNFLLSYTANLLQTNLKTTAGYTGFNNSANLSFDNLIYESADGVLKLLNDLGWNNWVNYIAPDATGLVGLPQNASTFGIYPSSTHNTSNGIATYADDSSFTFAIVDTWLNQWVTYTINVLADFVYPLDGIVWATSTNFLTGDETFYGGAYNINTHSWDVDSVTLPASLIGTPTIINATAEWYDQNNVKQFFGYNSNSGWGNYQTTPRLDFCIKNLQSPTNHNLVFIRDYSIGYPYVLYDFGDGYASEKRAMSHLYKTNGHYRLGTNNYTVCALAGGISTCKPVSFTTQTDDMGSTKKSFLVFPNPAYGAINIFLSDYSAPVNATLSDLMGHTIKQFQITSANHHLSVGDIASGLYLLKIQDSINKVLIKQ